MLTKYHATRCPTAALLLCPLLLLATAPASAAAAARVQFELVTDTGFPLAGAQRWIELFRKIDQTSIRVRSIRDGDREAVTNLGTERAPSYHVLGVLTAGNQLLLPGRKPLGLGDRTAIANWIKNLQQDGIAGLTAVKLAFGLTSEELVKFHERLAKPIGFPTYNVRTGDIARRIVQTLGMPFDVTGQARAAFGRHERVLDVLEGVSSGTALAAALRPLGLVVAPQKKDGQVRLLIGAAGEISESWPIGWPPQDSPFKIAPALFQYLVVEIADQTPLSDVTTEIQSRVKMPFLYDHNTIARDRLDPKRSPVSFPEKRTFYKKILDTVLFQARLQSELKVDDAGTPFLWISSTRP